MSTWTFRPATRQNTPLIVGIAGPTKAGKSMSALRLAVGLAGGKTIAMLNTEGPRGHMYAERFTYIASDMEAPFRATRYTEALHVLKTMDLGCVIIDSISHSHDGPGGTLEWHEEILDRIAGKDYAKRERSTFVAWVEPKAAEGQLIYAMQELTCPVILTMRAKEKIKIVPGKPVTDLGWQPIVGERVAFETIFTLMLPPHSKGVPDLSISDMREPFDTMIEPGKQIDEDLGQRLAAWANGGVEVRTPPAPAQGKGQAKDAPESQPGHPSRPQLSRLFALKTKHMVLDETLKLKLLQYGVENTKDLSLEQYKAVCDWIQAPANVPDGAGPASDEQWDTLRERATAARLLPEGWARLREQNDYAAALQHLAYMESTASQQEGQ